MLPRKLKPGDTVAIVSPSWGGPSVFPHVYENGLKILTNWGLKIKEYPTARADADYLRKNPEVRAKDINDAFSDPEVKAIFTSIGGDDSVRILPYLNKEIIKNNPKILLGFSDTTTIHAFCNQLELVTFYGPSIMAGFSQMKNLSESFERHVKEMLFEPRATYAYSPYGEYADGYLDWSDENNLGKTKEFKKDDGWKFLQGKGIVRGELFGGCIEVLEMMKGTQFWPKSEFWDGKILILETSEEKPTIHEIDHELRNYGMQGIFDRINGIVFGRARDYSAEEKLELEKRIITIVKDEFGRADLPIITNMDFGHTDPQFVLPLGANAEIDCENKRFGIIEPWLI
ncbi:MAG: S66 peptidase family protein [Parcubacteria group bacterium]|jgi:muramoyltetrapeptide carboxypeptidase LdcA involved in peptidoglycan recycling